MALSLQKGYNFANGEKVTRAKLHQLVDDATINGAGTMALQNANAVAITGGNAALSIMAADHITENVETGYGTGGSIALAMDGKSRAYIGLASAPTFSVTGMQAGYRLEVTLKNTTAGSLALTWPAWSTPAGVTMPASLAAGAYLIINLRAHGANLADVVPTYN